MSRAKLNSPAAAAGAAAAVEHVYKPDICKEGNASFAGTFSKQIFFDLFLAPFSDATTNRRSVYNNNNNNKEYKEEEISGWH